MKKRMLPLLLVLTLCFIIPTQAAWYTPAQQYVEGNDLMSPTANGFDHGNTVSIEVVFEALWRLEGRPTPKVQTVPNSVAASWAYEVGLATDTDISNYDGNRTMTRGGAAIILQRYSALYGITLENMGADYLKNMKNAPDYSFIPDWAYDGMCFCYARNVIQGDHKGYLSPSGTLIRREFAEMLRKLGKLENPEAEAAKTYVRSLIGLNSGNRDQYVQLFCNTYNVKNASSTVTEKVGNLCSEVLEKGKYEVISTEAVNNGFKVTVQIQTPNTFAQGNQNLEKDLNNTFFQQYQKEREATAATYLQAVQTAERERDRAQENVTKAESSSSWQIRTIQLDVESAEDSVARAERDLEEAKTGLENAKENRTVRLAGGGWTYDERLVQRAQRDVDFAESALASAERNLERQEIRLEQASAEVTKAKQELKTAEQKLKEAQTAYQNATKNSLSVDNMTDAERVTYNEAILACFDNYLKKTTLSEPATYTITISQGKSGWAVTDNKELTQLINALLGMK